MPSMFTRLADRGIRVDPRDSPDLRAAGDRTLPPGPIRADIRVRPGSSRLPPGRRTRHDGRMTDQQHAAAEPDPDPGAPGPGAPPPGPGPQDAVPASGAPGEEPRAHGDASAPKSPRKFRRDPRQKMLGGVCSGL